MIGAPFETKMHIVKNKEYFDSVPLDLMMCGILTYVRGTQLWQNAYSRGILRKGELIVQTNRRLSNYSYEELNLIKDDLTKHFLKNLRRWLRIQYKILRYGEFRIFLKQILIVKDLIRKSQGFETW